MAYHELRLLILWFYARAKRRYVVIFDPIRYILAKIRTITATFVAGSEEKAANCHILIR